MWRFTSAATDGATDWQQVKKVLDWAIYGPFSRDNDPLQDRGCGAETVVVPTGAGHTGSLPFHRQKSSYRTTFGVGRYHSRAVTILFDGAMSNAHVKEPHSAVGSIARAEMAVTALMRIWLRPCSTLREPKRSQAAVGYSASDTI